MFLYYLKIHDLDLVGVHEMFWTLNTSVIATSYLQSQKLSKRYLLLILLYDCMTAGLMISYLRICWIK